MQNLLNFALCQTKGSCPPSKLSDPHAKGVIMPLPAQPTPGSGAPDSTDLHDILVHGRKGCGEILGGGRFANAAFAVDGYFRSL
jgi:hypothetical protein